MENVEKKFVEHLCELEEKTTSPEKTEEQKVHDAIAHVDPNLLLRNLAFWLDIAIAKGRYIDAISQMKQENGVSTSSNDKEPQV